MLIRRRLLALLAAALLVCFASLTAFAHEVPDTSEKGSIQITMHMGDTVVPGGSLTLYRVGAVQEEDGNYSFVLTGDFTESGADLTDISAEALAKQLADYAGSQKLAGQTEAIGEDGKVSFVDLELGLYLLVQNEAAKGYNKAEPFLVSVPMNENGVYVYAVDASPKVELETAPEPTTPPTTPSVPQLPQTGQLKWPVPVLVVLGLMLFAAGWALRFGRKRGSNEE